jgi:hypothetical protein
MITGNKLRVTFKSGRQRQIEGDLRVLYHSAQKTYEVTEEESSTRWDIPFKQVELLEIEDSIQDIKF